MTQEGKPRKRGASGKRSRDDRVNVDVFCELGTPPKRGLGRIRDLNRDGCFIHTPRIMKLDEILVLSIQLPGFSQETS